MKNALSAPGQDPVTSLDPEYWKPQTFSVDMDKVIQLATQPNRTWRLEFECHGAPFIWTGKALSESMATAKAVADLSEDHPTFNRYKARLMVCVEGASA